MAAEPARVTTGILIGKFMPVHLGHQVVIDAARAAVDRLTIILFIKQNEPIGGDVRLRWLRTLYPDVDVRCSYEEHAVDYDDPAAWDLWIGAIRRVYPQGPDVVFTSEPYGEELAKRLGARHEVIDLERGRVPISGTKIRENPLACWEYLPGPVRLYFLKRIAIVGPESTGKTTLARRLAEHFGTAWSPEYAREYLAARGGVCLAEDMPRIARGHAEAEEAAAMRAEKLLFVDTDARTTALWSEHYFGCVDETVRKLALQSRYALYLLCRPDTPWVADGLRDCPDRRAWFYSRIKAELTAECLPFVEIHGNWDERWATALRAMTGLDATVAVADSN